MPAAHSGAVTATEVLPARYHDSSYKKLNAEWDYLDFTSQESLSAKVPRTEDPTHLFKHHS